MRILKARWHCDASSLVTQIHECRKSRAAGLLQCSLDSGHSLPAPSGGRSAYSVLLAEPRQSPGCSCMTQVKRPRKCLSHRARAARPRGWPAGTQPQGEPSTHHAGQRHCCARGKQNQPRKEILQNWLLQPLFFGVYFYHLLIREKLRWQEWGRQRERKREGERD